MKSHTSSQNDAAQAAAVGRTRPGTVRRTGGGPRKRTLPAMRTP